VSSKQNDQTVGELSSRPVSEASITRSSIMHVLYAVSVDRVIVMVRCRLRLRTKFGVG